jgi:predicted negative regulator of RcsB-dependent stress response
VHPKLNKPDEGLKLVEAFIAKFPKSIHLGAITALRADLRLAKGDMAGAEADYRAVEKNAAAWGFPASRGLLGLAETFKRAKKFAEAVQLLAPAFAAAKEPDAFSSLGLGLADMQVAAGQKDDARKTLRQVALGPGDALARGEAHLRLARQLADGASGKALALAFDHAVLAANVGAEDAVEQAARALARELAGKIDKDKSFSDEERKEYKDYNRNL